MNLRPHPDLQKVLTAWPKVVSESARAIPLALLESGTLLAFASEQVAATLDEKSGKIVAAVNALTRGPDVVTRLRVIRADEDAAVLAHLVLHLLNRVQSLNEELGALEGR